MRLLRFLLFSFSIVPGMANAVTMFVNHPGININIPLDYDAYVYGSYNYLTQSKYFINGVPNRLNDTAENGGRLQQAYFTLSNLQQGFGGFFDVVAGLDAYTLAPLGWNANFFNINNVGVAVPEAYFQYRWKTDHIIKLGMLMTVMGYEPYTYLATTYFSHSILNGYAQPGTHVGARYAKLLDKTWSYYFGVGNGWNTIREPTQPGLVEAGVIYTDDAKSSLTVNLMVNRNYLTDISTSGPTGIRQLIDIFGNYQLTDPLGVAFNLDYGAQSRALLPTLATSHAVWDGIAGYLTYDLTERIQSSFRAEIFNDVDGYRTGIRQVWKELTLSFIYRPVKHLTLLAEVRHDFSNVNSFEQSNGIGAINNQQSFAFTVMVNLAQ